MVEQFISVACVAIMVAIGILVTVKAMSLEDSGKIIGRMLLAVLLLSLAVCLFREVTFIALHILSAALRNLLHWLLVAIFIVAPLTLALWIALTRFRKPTGPRTRLE
jgi:hypothetical protein